MEDFQRWKDIQGSIDGTMGVNELKSWKKVLEKLKGKVNGQGKRD